ncbi:Nitroreductase [Hyaloscypha variabilis]
MQIPAWQFLACIFFAAVWHDMASLLRRSTAGLGRYTNMKASLPPFFSSLNPPKSSPFSTTLTANKMSPHSTSPSTAADTFLSALATRRSNYALTSTSPIPDSRIQHLINQCILHAPSAFNSQSTRIVLLLKNEHQKLWDITRDVLKEVVPADQFPKTEAKIASFRAAYGTVLFYTDHATLRVYQEKFALYADRFPTWGTESTAMHQLAVWTALNLEGLGANLQHYNPLVDERVAKEWGVSKDWELMSMLVFGAPVAEPGVRTYEAVEERVRVFGA